MTLALTILRRELLGAPRRKRFYLARTALIVLGSVVLLWGFATGLLSFSGAAGLHIFMSLSMATLVGMCVMSTTAALSLIRREKDDRTLGLVLLTDVSVGQFVLGKLLTAMFSNTMGIASVLPLFMLSISLGGVSAAQIFTAWGILLSVIFLGNSVGLLVASITRTERNAQGLLTFFVICHFIILPIAIWIYGEVKHIPYSREIISTLSPFVAMTHAIEGRTLWAGAWNSGLSLVLGSLALALTPAALRWSLVNEDGATPSRKFQRNWRAFWQARVWRVPRTTDENPVIWKDLNFVYGGLSGGWWRAFATFAFVTLVVASIFLYLVFKLHESVKFENFMQSVTISLFVTFSLVCSFMSLSHFGQSFQSERKSRAMELLLTTPLSDAEIFQGKMLAVLKCMIPWAVFWAVSMWWMLIMFGKEGDFWKPIPFILIEAVSMWLGYSAFCMWLSVRTKRNVAMGFCLLIFLVYNFLGRGMFTVFIGVFSALGRSFGSGEFFMYLMAFIDAAVHLGLGWLFLSLAYRGFRQRMLQD